MVCLFLVTFNYYVDGFRISSISCKYKFCYFFHLFRYILGQVNSLLISTIGAAESAIGLAILIIYYRLRGSLAVDLINVLKG
jgi:NADH-quinone oxidoreductase subunit K